MCLLILLAQNPNVTYSNPNSTLLDSTKQTIKIIFSVSLDCQRFFFILNVNHHFVKPPFYWEDTNVQKIDPYEGKDKIIPV